LTNLSWHTNLRQAADHLRELMAHPDSLTRNVAVDVWMSLHERYPNSFSEHPPEPSEWELEVARARILTGRTGAAGHTLELGCGRKVFFGQGEQLVYMWGPPVVDTVCQGQGALAAGARLTRLSYEQCLDHLSTRPKGAAVPRHLAELGTVTSVFLLDYGSYRDVQRHRHGFQRFPLLTTELGFHPWYLAQLPDGLRSRAEELLREQQEAIMQLPCDPFTAQNYVAMGYRVPCMITQTLPGLIYRLELRSGKMVHPTLREVTLAEASLFRQAFPDAALYLDEAPLDCFNVRRGAQTITEK
jgi:hypothetical protein